MRADFRLLVHRLAAERARLGVNVGTVAGRVNVGRVRHLAVRPLAAFVTIVVVFVSIHACTTATVFVDDPHLIQLQLKPPLWNDELQMDLLPKNTNLPTPHPTRQDDPIPQVPEPRWQALLAVLAVGLLYLALPPSLSVGPTWVATTIVLILAAASFVTHQVGWCEINHWTGHLLSSVLTIFMIWSLALLIRAVPRHAEPPVELLRSATALWVTNILVFALWYWRLDGGGPYARDLKAGHETGAFLFPQMTKDGDAGWEAREDQLWSPQFIDYLFLAFNTSTAFSPTDAPVLSRWAKVMMMIQSCISLAVVVILAGRAVNIM
jgi:hypothetical protein